MLAAKDAPVATAPEVEPETAALIVDAAAPKNLSPRMSVVITWPDAAESLKDLLMQRVESDAHVPDTVVVTTAQVDRALTSAFPDVRFVAAPADAGRKRMRELGVRAARGDVIVLIDGSAASAGAGGVVAAGNPR